MDKMTLTRTIVIILVLLNQVLVLSGLNPLPFSEEQLYEGVTAVLTVSATLWAYWKNNNITKPAKEAQALLDELKNKKE